jgi:hypothetical protein
VKYTSPFFLGHTKSSGFQFSTDWGADDAWGVALRYAEEFGPIRFAAGIGFQDFRGPDRGFCMDGSNAATGTVPSAATGSNIDCNSLQMSASALHTPTGLFISGGYSELNNKNSNRALAVVNAAQTPASGKSDVWWIMAGWQAKLNPLGSTIFYGQYVDLNAGLNGTNGQVSTFATTDQLALGLGGVLGANAIIRSANTQSWGLGVTQNIDAAAMSLYAGFHNVSTDINLGSAVAGNANRAKSNAIDDFQVFYTGATIKF